MPTVQCQHCNQQLENFLRTCPHCDQRVLAVSAIRFLGQGLIEFLERQAIVAPELAKKKTTLYLKYCEAFICDSERAFVSVSTFGGSLDERSYEAIKDVIGSHREHLATLKSVLPLIALSPQLAPVVKRVDRTNRQLENQLRKWMNGNFGGRTFGH